ncbi:tRNA (guanosine(46)-N7)-methyltransferase TrmB [Mycoplasmatota bacterium WC44]
MRLRNVKGAAELIENNSDIIIPNPENHKGKWNKVFGNDNPIHIEIGCGKGQYIYEMAIKYPDINFIAIDMFDSVIVRALQKFIDNKLPNVRLLRFDAFNIDDIFDKEVDTIYLNFSDPWPKERHAKRRLTHEKFLFKYEKIIINDIIFKTDNIDLFNYSVESMTEYGMDIKEVTYDLHSLNVENVMTEFEKKFSNLGMKINRIIANFKE